MPAESLTTRAARTLWPAPAGGWVRLHPCLRRRVPEARDWTADDFLALSGEIVSGHPRRHVVAVRLGERGWRAYLKREHRVPVRSRVVNLLAGFGCVSDSEREARTLDALRRAGQPAPNWLAYGESGDGRAFVLVRALTGRRALPRLIDEELPPGHPRRRRLARAIGAALAGLHAAGFDHPDLLAKHVFVRRGTVELALIDWPRASRPRHVPLHRRAADLALLAASLAGRVTNGELLTALVAYWRHTDLPRAYRAMFGHVVAERAARFAGKRSVRACAALSPGPSPRLRWLDGEGLCVTRELWHSLHGDVPLWLSHLAQEEPLGVQRGARSLPVWGQVEWVHRPAARREVGEPRRAGWLFRLRRFGVGGPRPLAFGVQPGGASFSLVKPAVLVATFPMLLTEAAAWPRLGAGLRRLHDAGCRWAGPLTAVGVDAAGRFAVADADGLARFPGGDRAALAALRAWLPAMPPARVRAACVALVRGYRGGAKLDATGRRWVARLWRAGGKG